MRVRLRLRHGAVVRCGEMDTRVAVGRRAARADTHVELTGRRALLRRLLSGRRMAPLPGRAPAIPRRGTRNASAARPIPEPAIAERRPHGGETTRTVKDISRSLLVCSSSAPRCLMGKRRARFVIRSPHMATIGETLNALFEAERSARAHHAALRSEGDAKLIPELRAATAAALKARGRGRGHPPARAPSAFLLGDCEGDAGRRSPHRHLGGYVSGGA